MFHAELAFDHAEVALTPRSFHIEEGLDELFEVLVTAGCPAADVDLEAVVGRGAALRLGTRDPERPFAVWNGVCVDAEQVSIEPDGVSIYVLRIVPMLWRTTQRTNYRIFQNETDVAVVSAVLDEWGIVPELRLEDGGLPRREYRVQFGESDMAFVSRLLEEAGVHYFFEQVEANERDTTRLTLATRLGTAASTRARVLQHAGHTEQWLERPFATKVRVGRDLRPGRFTIAGYDYRASPELRLLAEARTRSELERRYERFDYHTPAFLEVERDAVAVSEPRGRQSAALAMERGLSRQRRIALTTGEVTLAPGMTFTVEGHPRAELGAPLLATRRRLRGEVHGEWHIEIEAVPAADALRPELKTPRPRVMGVQSAVVMGPPGEEIHTDELGRVKLQFHWDRYGRRNDKSSCWVRVSQAWAGGGYGMSAIPRVGHEVLVDFYDGDPEQPVVVGRVYHRGNPPPDALPRRSTRTTWKSCSSPGGDGYNELSMDDARGEELLFMRAQRNLETQVLNDEKHGVGRHLETNVRHNERRSVGGDQQLRVRGDRVVDVQGRHAVRARGGLQTQAGELTGIAVSEGKLVLTNGSASIVLDGPHVRIDAGANVRVSAGGLLGLYGKEVAVDGTPEVFINSSRAVPPAIEQLPGAGRAGEGRTSSDRAVRERVDRGPDGMPRRPERIDDAELERRRRYRDLMRQPPPHRLMLPDGVNNQLQRLSKLAVKSGIAHGKLLDPDVWAAVQGRLDRRVHLETGRLHRLGGDLHRIFDGQREHLTGLRQALADRLEHERQVLGEMRGELGAIFAGEHGGFFDSAKALVKVGGAQLRQLVALQRDLLGMLAREKAFLDRFARQWKQAVADVKSIIDTFETLIENPEHVLHDILGPDVAELLGVEGPPPAHPPAHPPPAHPPAHPPPAHPPPAHTDGSRTQYPNTRTQHPNTRTQEPAPHLKPTPADKMASPKPKPQPEPAPVHEMKGTPAAQPAKVKPASHTSKASQPLPQTAQASQMKSSSAAKTAQLTAAGAAQAGALAASAALPSDAMDTSSGYGFARDGGIAAGDVSSMVKTDEPTFLMSPGEGQVMTLPTEGAQPIDPSVLSGAMVDAQMAGTPVTDAIATSLEELGYAVYVRPWDDWFGELVRTVSATVGV